VSAARRIRRRPSTVLTQKAESPAVTRKSVEGALVVARG